MKTNLTPDQLRTMIAKTGLTQTEFAAQAGYSHRQLCRFLSGDSPISQRVYRNLVSADVFHVKQTRRGKSKSPG